MISCISCENIHEFGPAFHSQFRLRYGGFVERQQYDVSVYDGMEFDRYDTPASRYLVYHTDEGRALGVSRLTPTMLSCMLAGSVAALVEDKTLLQSETVWEGTRYCVDKDVAPDLRQRIVHEMACAYLEFGLRSRPAEDGIAEGFIADVDTHPRNLSSKAAQWSFVILGHRRAIIDTDVGEIVGWYMNDGSRKPRLPDLLSINQQRAKPSLTNSAAVIFELIANSMVAGCERLGAARVNVSNT